MFLHVFAMYDFLNISCAALFQVLKNHPLVGITVGLEVWMTHHTTCNESLRLTFQQLQSLTKPWRKCASTNVHIWLNLQQLEILESKSIQKFCCGMKCSWWGVVKTCSSPKDHCLLCVPYLWHGSCTVFVFMIPIIYQYMDVYGMVFGCFFGYRGLVSPLIWVVSCNLDDHSATWK